MLELKPQMLQNYVLKMLVRDIEENHLSTLSDWFNLTKNTIPDKISSFTVKILSPTNDFASHILLPMGMQNT